MLLLSLLWSVSARFWRISTLSLPGLPVGLQGEGKCAEISTQNVAFALWAWWLLAMLMFERQPFYERQSATGQLQQKRLRPSCVPCGVPRIIWLPSMWRNNLDKTDLSSDLLTGPSLCSYACLFQFQEIPFQSLGQFCQLGVWAPNQTNIQAYPVMMCCKNRMSVRKGNLQICLSEQSKAGHRLMSISSRKHTLFSVFQDLSKLCSWSRIDMIIKIWSNPSKRCFSTEMWIALTGFF